MLAHRAAILVIYRDDLLQFVHANPDWLTWQFLRREALAAHLLLSLWYLQQTPPLPNLVLGLGIQAFGWPTGAAFFCVALSGLFSALNAVLMWGQLRRLQVGCIASATAPVLLFTSLDALAIEYNSFGQSFYEGMAQTGMLATLGCFAAFARSEKLREQLGWTALLGVVTGGLALSRASFALFFVIPLCGIALRRPRRLLCHVAVFLAGVALLQGGWAAKNRWVYGSWSWAATSWQGGNLVSGLARTGYGDLFMRGILADAAEYPPWFLRLLRERGLGAWHPPLFLEYVPDAVRRRDREIDAALWGTNQSENSVAQSEFFALYTRAYLEFAARHPAVILDKTLRSYEIFWQPIRNYPNEFMALFSVEPRVSGPLGIARIPLGLTRGDLPEPVRITSGPAGHLQRRRISAPGLSAIPLLIHAVNALALHAAAPIVLAWGVLGARRGTRRAPWSLGLLCASYLYVALACNTSEHGENMRFRVAVEPIVWMITLLSARDLWRRFRERFDRPADPAAVG